MKRIATAAVLAPLAFWIIVSAPPWLFAACTAAVAALCFHEFAGLAALQSIRLSPLIGQAAGLVLLLTPHPAPLAVLLAAVLAAMAVSMRGDLKSVVPDTGAMALGLLYCFATWRCALELRSVSPYWLLFALSINWVGDTCAFAGGKLLGRHKLAPRVSPGKTWEGSAVSMAGAIGFTWIYLGIFLPSVPRDAGTVGLAAATNLAGQLGDLCESAIKRASNAKDSGSMLPGHGGWLDRLDSSLFTVPLVFLWLSQGGSLGMLALRP